MLEYKNDLRYTVLLKIVSKILFVGVDELMCYVNQIIEKGLELAYL